MKRNAVRAENVHQEALLRLLRDGGRSRAEIADLVELSRSKLNAELDRLIEMGLVEQAGLAASRGGRRSGMVRLSPHLRFAAIDIGATSIDVAVTNGELEILGHIGEPADVRDGPVAVLDRAVTLLGKLQEQGVFTTLHGAGIGVPGPVSFRDGVPVAPPIMPGWDRYPVREVISQELGCPAVVDNDVNLMAMGELHSGLAKQVEDFLLVKIGTGIGCGIVVGGKIYRGVSGSAGDIGHIRVDDQGPTCKCGNTGCLEAYFGGAALAAEAVKIAPRSPYLSERLAATGELTAKDVAAAATLGDPAAIKLIRDGGRKVGQVLASLVSFFNPGLVIIAGGVARIGHVLLAEIRSVVYRRSLPLATGNLPIVLSELGDRAGVIGGARLITDHVFSASPSTTGPRITARRGAYR
ncbi:sugar kinase [Thermobispora bispora]|uniref:ROK family protein n=1 Tax=Thermobispora bispora (strain ATCC 19993 / DSM 43833 / CBS 139.67 / JCM 10125 / KCTC 9307 / NBRC 14880 / R51) TaxID=469371 RepID=D6Y6U3_THEBD|nr:ROK family transcriptional regulator [Thermobispora bispora]MBO2474761.1 ROK family transcriptional regulator [Actinomycetales bacterium]MDI9581375.1 ROK family transcriptional regulator [Thermobispora sp.]ADG89584.1 ROK family protein [Thermobispora bispora DSM 43833]MBX6166318.1 ROK family transcriptional regulator [Thermobispora bispora]QSI49204.1 ROK family transcriptional regulator [Thermobispora bispora]